MLATLVKIILWAVVLTDGLLFVFLLFKTKRVVHYFLLLNIFGIFGWAASILSLFNQLNLLAAKLTFVFALLSTAANYWFFRIYPENKISARASDYLLLLPTAAVGILSFLDGMLFSNVCIVDGYYFSVENGRMSAAYSLLVFYYIIVPLAILFKKLKARIENDYIRQQIKYLLAASVVFLFICFLTNNVLPVFFNFYFFNGLGPFFALFYVFAIFYIITRYKFLDIKLIIQRSVIYSALFALVGFFYVLIVLLIGEFFQRQTEITHILSSGITALVGAFTIPTLEKYFRRKTDRFFFKDKYSYSRALFALSEILNKNLAVEEILEKTAAEIIRIIKAERVNYLLSGASYFFERQRRWPGEGGWPNNFFDKPAVKEAVSKAEIAFLLNEGSVKTDVAVLSGLKDYLEKNGLSWVIPIDLKEKRISLLFLGDKLSGEPYGREDIDLFNTFANQAAVALEKARLFELEKGYAEKLEIRVKNRTEKIRRLQEGQKQMMLDISHGLQTPLTVVKGELEFLEEQFPDNQKIFSFHKSIDQISKFIYDMLKLSRLETGEADVWLEEINLSQILEEMVEYLKVLAEDKRISLEGRIEPDIRIAGRKEMIEEMTANLVGNAIKYIGQGNRIAISLARAGGKVEMVVKDDGPGIAADDLPKLFNRFYRIKNKESSKIKGTGLGLAIVKKIVDQHKASIRAESELGIGTSFIIEFDAA